MTRELLQKYSPYIFGVASRLFPQWVAKRACEMFLTPILISPPPAEEEFLSTADERREINGCPLWGWGKSHRRALLVHGWSGRGAQLRSLVKPLRELGYEVWLTDFPGHGQSDRELTHLGRFIGHVSSVANEWGQIDLAIGHSLGAAALFAASAEGTPISRLFLIGMPTDINRVFQSFCRRFALGKRCIEAFYTLVESKVGKTTSQVSAICIHSRVASSVSLVHDPNDEQVPLLHPKTLHELRPDYSMILIEGVGHYRILKSEKTKAALKEFAKF